MKVSTKGRYALRMMLDLALQGDEVVRIKDISLRQEISEKYLEQIVSVLKKAGYVNSVRGAQGILPGRKTAGIYGRNDSETDRRKHGAGSVCGYPDGWQRQYMQPGAGMHGA